MTTYATYADRHRGHDRRWDMYVRCDGLLMCVATEAVTGIVTIVTLVTDIVTGVTFVTAVTKPCRALYGGRN